MAEWKFGAVIDNRVATIMLVGVSDGTYRTTDHYKQEVPAGAWYGVTLVDKLPTDPNLGPYGDPGDMTWVLGKPSDAETEPPNEWTVLDE